MTSCRLRSSAGEVASLIGDPFFPRMKCLVAARPYACLGCRCRDPLLREFFCILSVGPRFVPKEFSKLSDVVLGCCEAPLDISLEHDPKVIGKPARGARRGRHPDVSGHTRERPD